MTCHDTTRQYSPRRATRLERDVHVVRHIVRDERRHADPEVDVVAVRELRGVRSRRDPIAAAAAAPSRSRGERREVDRRSRRRAGERAAGGGVASQTYVWLYDRGDPRRHAHALAPGSDDRSVRLVSFGRETRHVCFVASGSFDRETRRGFAARVEPTRSRLRASRVGGGHKNVRPRSLCFGQSARPPLPAPSSVRAHTPTTLAPRRAHTTRTRGRVAPRRALDSPP